MLESQKKEEKTAYASLSETKANSEERKQDYDHRLDGFAEFNILTDSECGFHFSIHYTFIRNPD